MSPKALRGPACFRPFHVPDDHPSNLADIQARAFLGKVESGFPSKNATNAKMLELLLFPVSVKPLYEHGPRRADATLLGRLHSRAALSANEEATRRHPEAVLDLKRPL
jgi:hypothetical protein